MQYVRASYHEKSEINLIYFFYLFYYQQIMTTQHRS